MGPLYVFRLLFYLHYKTSPHLLQLFKRTLQHCFCCESPEMFLWTLKHHSTFCPRGNEQMMIDFSIFGRTYALNAIPE